MSINTEEFRRQVKAGSPMVELNQRHVSGCEVLVNREELLKRLPFGGVGAEIGVAFGDLTGKLVALSRPSKLHLIDVWDSERYKSGLDEIRSKFSDRIISEEIVINQGLSTNKLREFEDSYFDWVYIDTDHSYKTTKEELLLCERKVKDNGIISGHDFTSGNVIKPWPYGVIEACNEFCVNFEFRYEYLTLESHGHFSFALKRI